MTSALTSLLAGSDTGLLDTMQTRGQGVEFIIDRNAVSIVLDRNNTKLAAQTVMITGIAASSEQTAESGTAAHAQVMVLCKDDADIQRGDRFSYNATPSTRLNYKVERVEPSFAGMKQCFATEGQ